MITKLIDNFTGRLTRDNIGDMNSGLAKYATTFGNDPFSNIGNLTWLEQPQSIAGIGGLIVAARVRLEKVGNRYITYVYALSDTTILYKIQVNDPATNNPNYDNPIQIGSININNPYFQYGSSIQFFGATEKIFVGHDIGVTKINFDGSGQTFVGTQSSYTQNVPRPSAQFLGKLYFGNGNNLVEIDSTETVTSYAKLSPGFPAGTYVRDLDVSPDGNYLQITVSHLNSQILDTIDQDTTSLASADSYRFLWNGTDTGYTAYESYHGYTMTSNTTFGPFSYTTGYDLGGAALYEGNLKIESLPNSVSPNFGAMFSTGNLLGFATSEYVSSDNLMETNLMFYGQYDQEVPKGMFRFLRLKGVSDNDSAQVPLCLLVSNLFYGARHSGYTGAVVGSAKLYFSVLESQTGSSSAFYRFYKFNLVPTGFGTTIGGVYETQQETSFKLFRNILKERLKAYEVRIFTPPLIANNSFLVDLIGDDGDPIPNASYTFTVGNPDVPVGTTLMKYNPQMAPSYSIGLRITNLGSKNWVCEKVEIDIDEIKA